MKSQMSRRSLLQIVGVTFVGSALAACVPIQAPPPTPSASAVSADDEAKLKKIETMLGKLNDGGLFQGVVLIARDGEILFNKAWGMADRQKKIPNTPQTVFRLAEVTVMFTAAAVLRLEQDKKLDVHKPISNYLSDSPQAWQEISLHHLLTYTSGIPDYTETAEGHKALQNGATPEQLLALFRDLPLQFKPGAQRVHSLSGFVVAGLIIEQVVGQSYGDYLKAHLFDPLQMKDSGYGEPPKGLALGYASTFTETPTVFDPTSLYAAGGCYSTAEDLYRWIEGLFNGHLLNDEQFKKMMTKYIPLEGDTTRSQGYGIILRTELNRQQAGDGGGDNGYGYSMTIRRFFDERMTTLMVGNLDMDTSILLDNVDQLMLT